MVANTDEICKNGIAESLSAAAPLPKAPVIGVIGLGYVGLPLACLFAKKYPMIGHDINAERVSEVADGFDRKEQCEDGSLRGAIDAGAKFTTAVSDLARCNVFIISVPTPVDKENLPDFTPLIESSRLVAQVLKRGDVVVYESTVYPGATEEICVPELEAASGLKFNHDFFVGYSPERIDPGSPLHTVSKIRKITSGSTPEAAIFVDRLYDSVLEAGTHRASSIKVAEAAKVLENTQRDVNIALMNEVSVIFDAIGIDTREVIEAASTKWNFNRYVPGLVGGHCISVDPYYLINKARHCGIDPMLMTAARRRNEQMTTDIINRVRRIMKEKSIPVKDARVLLVGFTFKANCGDTRNTKIENLYHELHDFTDNVDVYDPLVDPERAWQVHGIKISSKFEEIAGNRYDAVIFCVAHQVLAYYDIKSVMAEPCATFDIMGALAPGEVDARL